MLMLTPVSALLSLASFALSFQPAKVPARGAHTAKLDVPSTGMVHLEVKNGHGVSCTLVDRVNGPFATAGQVGKHDCATDQLLAAGSYRVELSGPAQARGEATLVARPFAELNQPPPRLAEGTAHEQRLRTGEQASYWIHVERASFVWLRARGRTAGQVALWRDGTWREPVSLHGGRVEDRGPEQPLYEWRVEQQLEAGDYLVAVYGTEPLAWSSGTPDDMLRVEAGFPALPATGRVSAVLPSSGVLTFRAPLAHAVAVLELPRAQTTATGLFVHALGADGSVTFEQGNGCQIAPRTQEPLCSVVGQAPSAQVFDIRGAPGTPFTLEVGPFAPWGQSLAARTNDVGRTFGPPGSTLPLRVATAGRFDVDLRDLPPDADAAPLSCALVESPERNPRVVARDYWRLPDGKRTVSRAFNYDGRHEAIAFEVGGGRSAMLSTSGDRKSHCELFRVEGDKRTQVASSTVASEEEGRAEGPCRLRVTLSAGAYELQLDGGNAGVETFAVGEEAAKPGAAGSAASNVRNAEPTKTSCKLSGVSLQPNTSYAFLTSRVGEAVARSLRVRPAGTADKTDDLWRAENAVSAYTPVRRELPVLEPGKAAYFDFERRETHALVFDAKEAGVYSLTTEGLLATACEIRTTTTASTASGTQGGRGRNCLAETYLEPGRYLATATSLGGSRGRAGVRLSKMAAKTAPSVTLKQPGAFSSAPGELVRQAIVVGGKRPTTLEIDTEALGPSLTCRLEDAEGWPLARASAPCRLRATLKPGRYVWMQLPLTTDTRRQTALSSTEPARVLRGKKTHVIALNQTYHVDLADRGHDTFVFRVPAPLDARVLLDQGMQGRLLRQSDDGKAWTPVEIIAARGQGEGGGDGDGGEGETEGSGEAPAVAQGGEGEGEGGGEGGGESEGESEGEGEGGHAESEGGDEAAPEAYQPPTTRRRKTQSQLAAELPALHLAAGRYRLVTEHAQGNQHIRYQVALLTDDLLPGISRDLDVPFKGKLRLPTAGLLELRTEGATDVTCRLFREQRLVAESHEDGSNWNCGLHEPLPAGEYEVVIEAASLQPGPSHVVLNMARPQDGPRLEAAVDQPAQKLAPFRVGARPVMLALPAATPDVLASLVLKSDRALSWALLDAQNRVQARVSAHGASKEPSFVLNARGEAHRLLLWTQAGTNAQATVQASFALAHVVDVAARDSLPRERFARLDLPRAGRYAVAESLLCLAEKTPGLLVPCGPAASLQAGPTLFAAREPGKTPKLVVEEKPKALEGGQTFSLHIGATPFIERQTNRTQAVHLLRVRLLADAGAEPSCQFASGVRALRGSECVALSTAAPEAIASISLPAGEADAEVTRMAWPLPATVQPLVPGTIAVTTEKIGARAALPQGPWQASLLLPTGAWAATLGPEGVARDFCPPEPALSRCLLTGDGGGELWLWTPDKQAVAGTLLAGTAPLVTTLGTDRAVLETWAREPRVTRIRIPAANAPRRLSLAGPEACVLHDGDGTRLPSCNATLAASHAYEMTVSQAAGPLRATVVPLAWEATPEPYLFVRPPPAASSAALQPGESVALSGTLVARTLTLVKDAVVSLRASSGVCGLFDADTPRVVKGAGSGCSVSRWLPAGRYVVAARAFADRPLDGALFVTLRDLESLGEGKWRAQSIGPGETRLFRFDMKAEGGVGLGLDLPAETLSCEILDVQQRTLGVGCQQLLSLKKGPYFLLVSAPAHVSPTRFRPVLLGLSGSATAVPTDYLESLRERASADAHEGAE